MKKVISITLVLENCDSIEFKNSELGAVNISKIHPVIKSLGVGEIVKYNVADLVVMEILNRNKKYSPFGTFPAEDKIKRIAEHSDITSIEISYVDGTIESYYVPYNEFDNTLGSPNVNQKTLVSKQGNLYLVIGEDDSIIDYFEQDYIDDENCVRGVCEDIHELTSDCLPDMYKYVYLSNSMDLDDENTECVLAMRVYDSAAHCKFIFKDTILENPTYWHYPERTVAQYIASEEVNGNFSVQAVKEKYPPKKTIDADMLKKKLGLTTDDVVDGIADITKKFGEISKKTEDVVTKGISAARNSQTAKDITEKTAKIAQKIAQKAEEFSKKAMESASAVVNTESKKDDDEEEDDSHIHIDIEE